MNQNHDRDDQLYNFTIARLARTSTFRLTSRSCPVWCSTDVSLWHCSYLLLQALKMVRPGRSSNPWETIWLGSGNNPVLTSFSLFSLSVINNSTVIQYSGKDQLPVKPTSIDTLRMIKYLSFLVPPARCLPTRDGGLCESRSLDVSYVRRIFNNIESDTFS